jgi:F-type H+-transporting ATPase subunit epsilon
MLRQISPILACTDRGYSYNRYLAIAARTVRRSLKETPRLAAERRGQMDLRFSKWEVS